MMNTDELLSVKEFAAAAGISPQWVYQLTKTTLKDYTQVLAKGKKRTVMLHKDGLKVLTCKDLQSTCKVLQSDLQSEEMQAGSGTDDNQSVSLAKHLQSDLQSERINDLKAELDSLHAHLEALTQQHADEIAEKNTQIRLLQEHTENQQQTIQALTAMLHPQQQLNAAAAVIQKQLIDQSGGASGDVTEADETPANSTVDQSEDNTSTEEKAAPGKRMTLWEWLTYPFRK